MGIHVGIARVELFVPIFPWETHSHLVQHVPKALKYRSFRDVALHLHVLEFLQSTSKKKNIPTNNY